MPTKREPVSATEKARANDRKARLRRLNRPVEVGIFPIANFSERKDTAVNQRLAEIFAAYDIDPSGAHSWEMLAWRLAADLFPRFEIVGVPAKASGRPSTWEKMKELLELYEAYQPSERSRQRGIGSKYKQFLSENKAKCAAVKITTDNALRSAVSKARQRRSKEKLQEDALERFEAIRALGIFGAPWEPKSSV